MLHCSRIVLRLYLPASRSVSLLNKNSLMFCKFLHFITAPLPSSVTVLKRVSSSSTTAFPSPGLPSLMPEFWETLMECNSQWVLIIHFPSAGDVWFITWIWSDGSVLKKRPHQSLHTHHVCISFQFPSSNSHSPLPDNQLCFSIVWRIHTHVRSSVF